MQFTQILQSTEPELTVDRANLVGAAYDELRKLAAGKLVGETQPRTLTSSALAHEVAIKLLADRQLPTDNQGKFFAYASTVMRNLLVDNARLRGRQKRGGHLQKRTFDDGLVVASEQCDSILALREALQKLAELEPRQAQVVELRFLRGLSNREVAQALGIALSTVKRDWSEARLWLTQELESE